MTTKKNFHVMGWLICGLGALFYCYEYFLRIMPSVMTKELMHAFHINATLLGNLAAFYYYAYTPMQLPVGVMMDRYGPKRLLIFAVQMCALGVLLFGTPGHLYLSYFGRFLVGFGSAFAFVGVLKLASMWLPLRFFGFIAGITTTLGMLGGMFGSIFLERIVRFSGWESTIKFSVIVALVLAVLIGLLMPERGASVVRQNMADAQAERASFRELFQNLLHLIKHPIIWLNGLVGCMLYLSLSVFGELWGPKYLQVTHHLTSQDAVGASSVIFLAWALAGPIIGIFAKDFRNSLRLLLIGSLVTLVAGIVLLFSKDFSLMDTKIVLFILGAGSAVEILTFNVACMLVEKPFAGTAIALTNMLVMLGGMVFEPLVGAVLDSLWHGAYVDGVKDYSPMAYHVGLSVLPIGALLSMFMVLYMMRKFRHHNIAH